MFPPLCKLPNFLMFAAVGAMLALSAALHSPYAQALVSFEPYGRTLSAPGWSCYAPSPRGLGRTATIPCAKRGKDAPPPPLPPDPWGGTPSRTADGLTADFRDV